MNDVNVLLGVDVDTVVTIVFIVVGLLTSLAQAANKKREEKEAGKKKEVPVDQPIVLDEPRPRPKPAPALEDEIGEFLRRAAKGRAGEKRPAEAKPVPMAARPGAPPARQPRPARPVVDRKGPTRTVQVEIPDDVPVAAEVVEPSPRPVGGQVEAKVAKDLDTSEFRRRGDRLGQQTRQKAKKTEQRVQAKFDHGLGKLADEPKRSVKPRRTPMPLATLPAIPETDATGIAAMFRDLNETRDVIILNEILTRPVDRW